MYEGLCAIVPGFHSEAFPPRFLFMRELSIFCSWVLEDKWALCLWNSPPPPLPHTHAPFLNTINTCSLSICFAFNSKRTFFLLYMFVKEIRTLCSPGSMMSLVAPYVALLLCFSSFYLFFFKLGNIFCIWAWTHCVFCSACCVVMERLKEICGYFC